MKMVDGFLLGTGFEGDLGDGAVQFLVTDFLVFST
jgi:hypothetical protein